MATRLIKQKVPRSEYVKRLMAMISDPVKMPKGGGMTMPRMGAAPSGGYTNADLATINRTSSPGGMGGF